MRCKCPLLRVKRTWRFALHMSAFDPKRTFCLFGYAPFRHSPSDRKVLGFFRHYTRPSFRGRMKRREFITLLGGAAAAWPLAARAQQGDRVRRIGVLVASYAQTDREGQARVAAFLDTFQRLGWTDGRNVRIEYRWSAGDSRSRKGLGGRIGPFSAGCDRGLGQSGVGRASPADQHDPDRVHPGRGPSRQRFCRRPCAAGWQYHRFPDLRRLRWAASGWGCSRRPRPT